MLVAAENLIKSDYLWSEGCVLRVVVGVTAIDDENTRVDWFLPEPEEFISHFVHDDVEYDIHRRKQV